MSPQEYREALSRLKLSIFGAGMYLGITGRQSQRYASGATKVPESKKKLLMEYLRNK